MFCPKCGTGQQQADAYCKRCGEWLSDVKGGKRRNQSPEQRLKTISILSGVSAVFSLFSTFVLYSIFFGGNRTGIIAAAAAFSLVVFIYQLFTAVSSVNLYLRLRRGRGAAHSEIQSNTGELNSAHGGILRAANTGEMIPPPSVTEQTTVLLQPIPRKGGRREE